MVEGKRLRTKVCDLLGIEYPILLAGMGIGISGADLAAAVSNAGGLGMLGCSRLSPDQIRDLIRRTRALTSRPFGVDIIAPPLTQSGLDYETLKRQIPEPYWRFIERIREELGAPDVPPPPYALTEEFLRRQMEVVIEEEVPVFATGLGTPRWILEEVRASGMRYISLVGKVKHVARLKASSIQPDVVVAQGSEAGGHTGRVGTFPLVPLVVEAASPIPVLAAGGISDGRGLVAALSLGAQGVWMGTAFLATHEALHDTVRFGWMTLEDADFYQQTVLEASEEDTVVTRVKTGKTCRMFKSPLLELWESSGLEPLSYQLQTILMNELESALMAAWRHEYVLHLGGQVAGRIRRKQSAKALVREVVEQALFVIDQELPRYAR